jgi:hypothetical protein
MPNVPEKTEVDKKADKGHVVVPISRAHLLDKDCLASGILEGGKRKK